MNIAIYTLTSPLHNEKAVEAATNEFLDSLHIHYDFQGTDFADYGSHVLDLLYIRTGGTEGVFRQLLPTLRGQSSRPFYLLTSGKSNSLAASMEILSYLRQQGIQGEIIHGSPSYITEKISLLERIGEARRRLSGLRLGIVGKPSDWLISSDADPDVVRERLGIELVDIPMQELLDEIELQKQEAASSFVPEGTPDPVRNALPGAERIYHALRSLVQRHGLGGFTLRCFDLLTTVRNTGCMALARLNAEGFVAGCEGDVPALLSMAIVRTLTGVSGFQANPARIDPQTGEMLMAHCTIPLDMVERYELDTHFESGIGVAIRGYVPMGPVTLFKVSGDLRRSFAAEGQLLQCQAQPDLCRTQQVIRLDNPAQATYFLTNPIGNHHIVLPGHHRELLEGLLE